MLYLSKVLDAERLLCLAPITQRQIEMADSEPSDCSGYFLFEQMGVTECKGVRILAQVHSDDAALELGSMMGLS